MAEHIRRDLYANVTARILAELERGAAPWIKPWPQTPGQNVPQNAVGGRPYSGCDVVLLWPAANRGYARHDMSHLSKRSKPAGTCARASMGPKSISLSSCKSGASRVKAKMQRASFL